ncbi:MAG TPA: ATP-binding cassette domain-containing protein [Vicinamibacterales bacterium]|nr:ATP-binding cassette domain-containing protein [Vicinamibacterales bacterium]
MVHIRVEHVSKRYDKTTALDDVSFEAGAGEVFGLLGPNGAGKTTIIRTILDLIRPDSGRVEILGHAFTAADRDRIGYLPEERGLYPRQKVGAVLEYLGALKGMAAPAAREESRRWLERFELADAYDKKVEQLSKGNQQKVQIAATFLASPAVAILDEPLSGLDPVGARLVNRVIRERAAAGQTILLSTHQMGMVEALCTRVFMIAKGRCVLYGDLREIIREHSTDSVRVVSNADYARCPLVARVTASEEGDRSAEVHLRDGATSGEFLRWLAASGAAVDRFERQAAPLEEIFIRKAAL